MPLSLKDSVSALSLLLVFHLEQHWAQDCTLCADGSTPSGQYPGGLECSVVAENIATLSMDSPLCFDTQVTAFEYCNCAGLPDGVCPLCANAGPVGFPELKLLDRGNVTCGMVEYPSDCLLVPYDAAWYCGCSATTRPSNASLCDNAAVPTRPNRILLPNSNCFQYDRTLGVGRDAESDTSIFGDNLQAYCGCPGTMNLPAPNSCSLCGGELPNPSRIVKGSTCAQIQTMTTYVNDTSACFQMKEDFGTCCQATEAPVTLAPNSMEPVAAPVSPPPAPPTSSAWRRSSCRMVAGLLVALVAR